MSGDGWLDGAGEVGGGEGWGRGPGGEEKGFGGDEEKGDPGICRGQSFRESAP
ncbi:hypothetical protein GCM10010361_36540 [Streptomyces olivaceiscleroticus]|uniref:Uncharacterized protein n=1 Tax=Streptomyces olivaceiscleroticus TaxID=68245 RepID=A0ABN1A6Z8_9ACTN